MYYLSFYPLSWPSCLSSYHFLIPVNLSSLLLHFHCYALKMIYWILADKQYLCSHTYTVNTIFFFIEAYEEQNLWKISFASLSIWGVIPGYSRNLITVLLSDLSTVLTNHFGAVDLIYRVCYAMYHSQEILGALKECQLSTGTPPQSE